MSASGQESEAPGPRVFATTHWSVVLAAGENDSFPAQRTLETLCRAYGYPIYVYVCRKGRRPEDAQDLTQEFFAQFIAKELHRLADRDKGRFRTFLLATLDYFLAREWSRAHRQKRGGQFKFVSLDQASPEERYQLEPVDHETPETKFAKQPAPAQEKKVLKPGLTGKGALGSGAVRDGLVRVVTIGQEGLQGESLIDDTFARLEQAASFQPDIACLPEDFTRGEPEAVPGPTTERVGKWAREHSCYVICPIRVRAGGRVYNSAVLIDRQGKVAGRYDKIHPTEDELERGICPGETDPPVFETDFGAIGIQICFDVNWREGWARLKQKGARIIFWPSAYAAAHQMPALALLNQCFVVTSTMKSASRIYDITGDLLDASANDRPWAGAVLPLGKRLFETDFNTSKMRQVETQYGSKVQVTWLRDDSWITLASLDPELAVEDIMKEFDLIPLDDYILRTQKAQDKQRLKK